MTFSSQNGAKSENGAKCKNDANVKNVKTFAETWYVKKTLVILAQMGQMLRIEKNAPFYKMGHVEKKCPKRQE